MTPSEKEKDVIPPVANRSSSSSDSHPENTPNIICDEEIEELYQQIKKHGSLPPSVMETTTTIEIPRAPDLRPLTKGVGENVKKTNPDPKKPPKSPSPKKRGIPAVLLVILLFLLAVASAFGLIYLLFESQLPWNAGNTELDHYENTQDQPSEVPEDNSSDLTSESFDPIYEEDEFPTSGFASSDASLTLQSKEEEKTNEDGGVVFQIRISHPTINYPTNLPAQKVIQKQMDKLYADIAHDAQVMAADYAVNFSEGDAVGSYESICTLLSAHPDILTLMVTTYAYTGGASPLVTVECYNYKAENGTLLAIGDLVTDTEKLCSLSISRIDKSLVWEGVYETAIRENVCDAWYPTPTGLTLIYQKYSIGPGASGTIEVSISYEELQEILNEDFVDPSNTSEA